jgi:hypothetical protein
MRHLNLVFIDDGDATGDCEKDIDGNENDEIIVTTGP